METMSTKRTYFCNVCRDEKSADQLVGWEWHGVNFAPKLSTQCENHVCVPCLRGMVYIASLTQATKDMFDTVGKGESR